MQIAILILALAINSLFAQTDSIDANKSIYTQLYNSKGKRLDCKSYAKVKIGEIKSIEKIITNHDDCIVRSYDILFIHPQKRSIKLKSNSALLFGEIKREMLNSKTGCKIFITKVNVYCKNDESTQIAKPIRIEIID